MNISSVHFQETPARGTWSSKQPKLYPDNLAIVALGLNCGAPQIDLPLEQGVASKDPKNPGVFPYSLGSGLSSDVSQHEITREDVQGTQFLKPGVVVALKRYLMPPDAESISSAKLSASFLRVLRNDLTVFCNPVLSQHRNIARLLFVGWEQNNIIPVLGLELAAFGTLEDLLSSQGNQFGKKPITHKDKARLTLDIASGIQALHACHIVHGDIKPNNVLVQADDTFGLVGRLTDFAGSSTDTEQTQTHHLEQHATRAWMCPEALLGETIVSYKKCDIYSFGLISATLWIDSGLHSGDPIDCFLGSFYSEEERDEAALRGFLEMKDIGDNDEGNVFRRAQQALGRNFQATTLLKNVLSRDPQDRQDAESLVQLISQIFYLDVAEKPISLPVVTTMPSPGQTKEEFRFSVFMPEFQNRNTRFQSLVLKEMLSMAESCNDDWPSAPAVGYDKSLPVVPTLLRAFLESQDCASRPPVADDPACRRFVSLAMELHFCYWRGTGTPRDDLQSLKWLHRAASLGNDWARATFQPLSDALACTMEYRPDRTWLLLSSVKGFRPSARCLQAYFPRDLEILQQAFPYIDGCPGPIVTSYATMKDLQSVLVAEKSIGYIAMRLLPVIDLTVTLATLARDDQVLKPLPWANEVYWRSLPEPCTPSFVTDVFGRERLLGILVGSVEVELLVAALESFTAQSPSNRPPIDFHRLLISSVATDRAELLNAMWRLGSPFTERRVATIKVLIDHGADPLHPNLHQMTALLRAVRADDVLAAKLFLEAAMEQREGFEQSFQDCAKFGGSDALRFSIYRGHLAMADLILAHKLCRLESRSSNGITALHVAAMTQDPRFARMLMEHGADPRSRANDGSTPFQRAVIFGNLEVADLLLPPQFKAEILGPNARGFTCFGAILAAALTNFRSSVTIEAFTYLRSKHALSFIVNVKDRTTAFEMLLLTPLTGRQDYALFRRQVLGFLLDCFPEDCAKLSSRGVAPLHLAALTVNLDAVYLLLEAGAEINQEALNRKTAMDIATSRRHHIPDYVFAGGAREIRRWRSALEKTISLLFGTGGVSGSGATLFEHIEALKLKDVHVSEPRPQPGVSFGESVSRGLLGAILPNPQESFARSEQYKSSWPATFDTEFAEVVSLGGDETQSATHLLGTTIGALPASSEGPSRASISSSGSEKANCSEKAVPKLSRDASLVEPHSQQDLSISRNAAQNVGSSEPMPQKPQVLERHIDQPLPPIEEYFLELTPFHHAAWEGSVDVLTKLLKQRMDPLARDKQGIAPIHVAARRAHFGAVEFLWKLQVDTNVKDVQGRNLVHHAAVSQNAEFVRQLLHFLQEQDFEMTDADRDGWTALHWAAKAGDLDVVKSFLEAGLSTQIDKLAWHLSQERVFLDETPTPTTGFGHWTPAEVALFHANENVRDYLAEPIRREYYNRQDYPGPPRKWDKKTIELLAETCTRKFYNVEHAGYYCDGCYTPILGNRYHCQECRSLDFCFKCYASASDSHPTHEFREVPALPKAARGNATHITLVKIGGEEQRQH